MASLFTQLFCCGRRARIHHPTIPNETTPLIPAVDEIPHAATHTTTPTDHERLKERLGTIVRAKEGKMVNINAHVPFNLHNKTLSHRLDPSASRASPSPSHSSVSLLESVASLAPPDEGLKPTLGVTLVESPARRGRSRTRRSTSDDDDEGAGADVRVDVRSDHDSIAASAHEHEYEEESDPELMKTPQPAHREFKIRVDGAAISRSWGD